MVRRRVTFGDLKRRSMRGDAYAREARTQGLAYAGSISRLRRAPYRPGTGVMVGGRRFGRRGGFFGSVFKGISKVVSTVAKVPVIGTLAKTALSAVPIVKLATTAVGAVKGLTASGTAPSMNFPHMTATPGLDTTTKAPRAKRRKRVKGKPKKRRAKRSGSGRARSAKGPAGGRRRASAKQRAARARFARAAKKGRIKKGARLR